MKPMYKRVLLKLSGEALAGDKGFGINNDVVNEIAVAIKKIQEIGVEVSVVVGGGNFWRGRTSEGMDRTTADYIGMLATVMNSRKHRCSNKSSNCYRNETNSRTIYKKKSS